MPSIEVSKKDMEDLIGRKLSDEVEELNDVFQYAGAEVESLEGDALQLEIKVRNRPDLWCAEGIARELKGALKIETGLAQFNVKPARITLHVEEGVKSIRPLIVAAIVKNVKITEELLVQIIQMQEKVCMTYGRKRKAAAMGIYDYDKVIGDVYYKAADPKTKFIPLEFNRELNLNEILKLHPKGEEYAHLLKGFKKYPLVVDSEGNVLSMPPIINSNYSGKVTDATTNLFIEVTGSDWETVHTSLLIAVASLADRGGKIEAVKVKYGNKIIVTPDFTPKKKTISLDVINTRLGLDLDAKHAADILKRGRYNAVASGSKINLEIPAYRADILHDVDIVEDVAVMYGYSNFDPQEINLYTIGELDKITKLANKVREVIVGFGAQEVQTFTLTDPAIFDKVGINGLVSVANPMSANYSVLRNKVYPMLIDFLSKNTNKEYPQMIFEVGDVVVANSKAETMSDTLKSVAFAFVGKDADVTYAKRVLVSLLSTLGKECVVKEVDAPAFIAGRAGEVYINNEKVGVLGELHPVVLSQFGLEMPVCTFEIDLTKIIV